jgi:MATE family multidrug resistance protein
MQVINLVCFWMIGLPMAWVFALKLGMGAVGLWRAMAVSSLLQALVLVAVVVCRFDWKGESERASGRLREQAGQGL